MGTAAIGVLAAMTRMTAKTRRQTRKHSSLFRKHGITVDVTGPKGVNSTQQIQAGGLAGCEEIAAPPYRKMNTRVVADLLFGSSTIDLFRNASPLPRYVAPLGYAYF
jgi:hypothetical protein